MRSSGGVVSASALEMKVVKPDRFEAVTQIAEHLLSHKTVVLNLEETNKETIRRIIDFMSGVAFAIEGNIKRVATLYIRYHPQKRGGVRRAAAA